MIAYGVTNSSTTHGGKVLADQSLGLANGLGWLTVGVGFSCPQCKKWAVFPSGDPSMTVNGKSVLLVGATANCGAVLLPAQSLFVKGGNSDATSEKNDSNKSQPQITSHAKRFLLHDSYGKPLIKKEYKVLVNGREIRGVTDSHGYTRSFLDAANHAVQLHVSNN